MTKRFSTKDVLEMLDEIPVDNEVNTDESSSDDQILDDEYFPPAHEIWSSVPQEISETNAETNATTAKPKQKGKSGKKVVSSSTQKKDKTLEQLDLIEQFLFENNLPVPLLASQVKHLQEIICGKSGEKLSVAQVNKLVEIARRHWKKVDKPSEDHVFNYPEGPNIAHFTDCHTQADVFSQFLDTDIIDMILFQTNLYITQRERNVASVTREELYGFLGINMLMSYHKLPSWTHYWNSDHDLSVAFVSSVMTRDRFAQILSNLHVNDNAAIPDDNKDKLYKLRPLIDALNSNYTKLYHMSQKFSIDESMILFKGRHSIKQYNPMKPIKRGYKVWVRADMDGYISKFDVYQGKVAEVTEASIAEDEGNKFGLGEKVIQTMTTDLFNKNHEVYFDNYFTSVPLMEYLKANGVNAAGTIRMNRKALPIGMEGALDRGDCDYRVSEDGLTLFKWQDNKAVYVLSNFHGTDISSVKRTQKDGSKDEFSCPVAVVDYNKYMGGVDKADMLCADQGLSRKSKKWWHRIFFGIIDRTVVNAQIVFSKLEGKSVSVLEYRRAVTQAFITRATPPKVGRPRSTPSPQVPTKRRKSGYSVSKDIRLQNLGAHWVTYEKKRGRCEICQKKQIESRPHSKCTMCKVHLCCNEHKNCFAEFHGIIPE